MPDCPHKSVKKLDTQNDILRIDRWICEWCNQAFIPKPEENRIASDGEAHDVAKLDN